MLELIQLYYQYNAWANHRILDTVERLTCEQYVAQCDVSFGSIHNLLVHIFGAQWLLLYRWQGNDTAATLPKPDQFAGLEQVRAYHEEVERDTRIFLAGLTEDRLAIPHNSPNLKNRFWSHPLGQLMLQQANHATQHRSEVAFITSQWGISPGAMDLTTFMDL